jgi:putative ATP-dependent endonuclease of OLD family
MGQSIVTSHSPHVIEQFDPDQIVILNRNEVGHLTGHPIDIREVKPKTFRTERRQFAEAILSRAVLVVEGSTGGSVCLFASRHGLCRGRGIPATYLLPGAASSGL